MKKIKALFAKIKNYVKNTAWIQPLLIVVVIFVVLFSLGPITEGIKSAWTSITTVNNMEKITFEEYVEKVEKQEAGEQRDFVVVFTQKGCEYCPSFYKSMNNYLKNGHKSADFDIFYIDLSVKSTFTEIPDKVNLFFIIIHPFFSRIFSSNPDVFSFKIIVPHPRGIVNGMEGSDKKTFLHYYGRKTQDFILSGTCGRKNPPLHFPPGDV